MTVEEAEIECKGGSGYFISDLSRLIGVTGPIPEWGDACHKHICECKVYHINFSVSETYSVSQTYVSICSQYHVNKKNNVSLSRHF